MTDNVYYRTRVLIFNIWSFWFCRKYFFLFKSKLPLVPTWGCLSCGLCSESWPPWSSLVYFCHDGVEIVRSTPLARLSLDLSYQSATSALYKLSFNPGSLSTNALLQEFSASHTAHSHLQLVQHNRLIGWMCDNYRTLIGWPVSSTTVVSSTLLKGEAAMIKRRGVKFQTVFPQIFQQVKSSVRT